MKETELFLSKVKEINSLTAVFLETCTWQENVEEIRDSLQVFLLAYSTQRKTSNINEDETKSLKNSHTSAEKCL